jgi:molybdenum cofactor cytidylyltransferase
MNPDNRQSSRVFAVVPAAGRSRRMGAAKQRLDVGGRTMLQAVLAPLVAAEVEGIVVVTHSAIAGEVVGTLPRGAFIAINDDPDSRMIDSIRIGLSEWSRREAVDDRDGFLVCPADQPDIATADFNACASAFRAAPDRIVIATWNGRLGHPIVFPASLSGVVRSPACGAGLNALPRTLPDRVWTVACRSHAVTRDVDTPEDYRKLLGGCDEPGDLV